MPRICDSTSGPIDFCKRCFPSETTAKKLYYNLGDGPDGRGNCFDYDACHPDYEGDDYKCSKCGKPLTSNDENADN